MKQITKQIEHIDKFLYGFFVDALYLSVLGLVCYVIYENIDYIIFL